MRICIVGPGAMGRLLGVLLSQGGYEIVLLDHRPSRAEMLGREGIRLIGAKKAFASLPVTVDPYRYLPFDVVFICVKAYDTERVAKRIADWAKESILVTLQNGMGNIEAIKKHIPSAPLVAGVTACGANIPPEIPNGVVYAGCGETVIGSPSSDRASLRTVLSLLKSASLPVRTTDNLQGELWGKLLINAAINPLCAILRIRNGELPENPPAWRLAKLILQEALTTAEAEGVRLPYPNTVEKVKEVCLLTRENRCSTLQDIEASRRTEIDSINGYIYRTAEKHSIAAPYNRMVTLLFDSFRR